MTAIISNVELIDLDLKELVITDPIGKDNPPLLITSFDNSIDNNAHTDPNGTTQQALQLSDFAVNWEEKVSDSVLDKLALEGWIVIDNVFEDKALLALQSESGFIDYREANLTAGVRISHIRGDKIRWINKDFFAGFYYLQSINQLASHLNRSLYTGIRHSEAHYACYPTGFGYQWHSDNPAGRDERVISAVFYLNDNWEATDGGAVEIVDSQGIHHEVMPVANRLIIFDSNLQHQVQIAHRQRYSIATWMRRDGLVPFVEEG
ncbi:2OG-Fe(II) oxygenase [Psychrobacter sp. AH5]|uniref:2OG-Fe(II) oxygenase n=1 Tax=Psychrobacter sp. AH5 TaxID=2937433 RepID=UPI003340F9AA